MRQPWVGQSSQYHGGTYHGQQSAPYRQQGYQGYQAPRQDTGRWEQRPNTQHQAGPPHQPQQGGSFAERRGEPPAPYGPGRQEQLQGQPQGLQRGGGAAAGQPVKREEQAHCKTCNSTTHTTAQCPYEVKENKKPTVAATSGQRQATGGLLGKHDHTSRQDARKEDSDSESGYSNYAAATQLGKAGLQVLKEIIQEAEQAFGAGGEPGRERAVWPGQLGQPCGLTQPGAAQPGLANRGGRSYWQHPRQALPNRRPLQEHPRRRAPTTGAATHLWQQPRDSQQAGVRARSPNTTARRDRADSSGQRAATQGQLHDATPRYPAGTRHPVRQAREEISRGKLQEQLENQTPEDQAKPLLMPSPYNWKWAEMVWEASKKPTTGLSIEAAVILRTYEGSKWRLQQEETSGQGGTRRWGQGMSTLSNLFLKPARSASFLSQQSLFQLQSYQMDAWSKDYEADVTGRGLGRALEARLESNGSWKSAMAPYNIKMVLADIYQVTANMGLAAPPAGFDRAFKKGTWSTETATEIGEVLQRIRLKVRDEAASQQHYNLAEDLNKRFRTAQRRGQDDPEVLELMPINAKAWKNHNYTWSWEELAWLADKVDDWLQVTDLPHSLKSNLLRELLPSVEEQRHGYTGACRWNKERALVANICASQMLQALLGRGPRLVASSTRQKGERTKAEEKQTWPGYKDLVLGIDSRPT